MQNKFKSRIQGWLKSLKEKYHLNLTNKDSFAEIYSTQVTKGKLLMYLFGSLILVFVMAFIVLSFTPLKKLIPGFESDEMHEELILMKNKMKVMEFEIAGKLAYANELDSIFTTNNGSKIIEEKEIQHYLNQTHNASAEDHTTQNQKKTLHHFYQPVTGIVSQKFNLKEKHFGVDVVTKKDEPIKSTLAGKVIFSSWTLGEGNVISIQHDHNLISFYKHNSVLLKHKGDFVKAGEVIAIVGNSGELSTGPHLHFEIWKEGNPLNPLTLVLFKE